MVERAYGPSLRHLGRDVRLSRRPTFTGFAYRGDGVSVRGRGEEGSKTLKITRDGKPKLECRAVPGLATPGVATGTIVYPQRVALPKGAMARIELRDTARADAAAPVLGSAEVRTRGNQVPLHWWLAYDARRVRHPARPGLSARVFDAEGRLIWVSDTFTPLPVGAGQSHADAEIRLVPAARR